jgi:hypothetical protein
VLLAAAVLLGGCRPTDETPAKALPVTPAAKDSREDDATGEVIDDSWSANFLNAAKLGYGHAVVKRVPNPKGEVIRTLATTTLRVKRYQQTTEETLKFRCDDTPEGQIISFHCDAPALGMESRGDVAGEFLNITTVTKGKSSTSTIPWDPETLGFYGVDDSLRRQPMKSGDKRRVKWLQPLLNIVSDDTLEALEEEETDLLGEKKRLLKIKSEGRLGKQVVRRTMWTDEKGLIWKTTNPETGEENFRTSEEIAKKPDDSAFDLGLSTIVNVDTQLKQPHETNRVVYRATLKHRDPKEVFATCGSQQVEAIDDRSAKITVLRVTATHPDKLDFKSEPPSDGDRKPNNLIQSDDARVQKMAKSIAPDEQDPAKIALSLEFEVKKRLTTKDFTTTFASAADVAKSLSGDCTEHAVLLAALCRARKIPARVAAGLVYVEERPSEQRPRGFAYHMWTEAWLNDRWVPLDATLGRGGIGAAHIKLFDTNLDGAAALEALLPLINVLGQLELEILEVE